MNHDQDPYRAAARKKAPRPSSQPYTDLNTSSGRMTNHHSRTLRVLIIIYDLTTGWQLTFQTRSMVKDRLNSEKVQNFHFFRLNCHFFGKITKMIIEWIPGYLRSHRCRAPYSLYMNELTLYMIFVIHCLSFLWFFVKNDNIGFQMKILKFPGI